MNESTELISIEPDDITEIVAHLALTGSIPTYYKNKSVSIKDLIEAVMPSLTLGENRELIVAKIIGADPLSNNKTGHDSVLEHKNQKRYIEIKTESFTDERKSSLGGSFSMGISSFELLESIKNDNPLLVVCGFTDNNDLIYMLSFDFSDPGFLNEWKIKGLSNNSNKHSFGYNKYKNYKSVVVHFINESLMDKCTKPFSRWLIKNIKSTNNVSLNGISIINEAF